MLKFKEIVSLDSPKTQCAFGKVGGRSQVKHWTNKDLPQQNITFGYYAG